MSTARRRPPINCRLLIAIWLGCAALAAPFAVGAVSDTQLPSPAPNASEATASATPDATPDPTSQQTTEPTTEPTGSRVTTEPPSTTAPATDEPAQPTPTPVPSATASDAPAGVGLLVVFTADGWSARQDAVAAVAGTLDNELPELHMAAVTVADAGAAAALRADPHVASVEQDRTRSAEGEPSDALFAQQWALPRIGWDAVYGAVAPSADVTVAVLDTGVDASHEDLRGRLVDGASFVDGADPAVDPNGHGTQMAGIVAAAADNSTGVAGTAWGNVRVMPVTVLDAEGNGLDSNIIAGIVHATDSGADVILLALSSRGYSPALQAAIDYAWSHDVVVVAAAGNDGSAVPAYPAADRGVVSVAATDQNDHLSASSNRGPAVFMAAPGLDILTTNSDGSYVSIDGTSASAAFVAGAAAVLRSVDPSISNAVVVARLARSAAPLAASDTAGNGRLDMARALADTSNVAIEPSGAAPNGDGGPFVGPYSAATVRTWTGNGADANWTTAANWGGTAPVAGDDLVFPAGAARLTANNNFAAATSFNSITISDTGYTLTGNSVALGAGGLTVSAAGATDTVSLALSLAAGRTMTVTDSGTTLTLAGIVSGSGGIIKTGDGVLALSATNTYSGMTTVSTGTVEIHSNAALGASTTGTTVAAGAAVTITGSGLSSAERFTLNGTGISGAGALRNTANSNTFSGALTLGSDATVYSAGGTLTLTGAITTGGFTLTVDGAGDTFKSAGAMTGAGALTKAGTGTLTLGSALKYTGATTVDDGTLMLAINNGIGPKSAVTISSGATFDLAGFDDSIGSLSGAGTVTSSGAGSPILTTGGNNGATDFSGTLSDGSATVGLTKVGNGVMTLSGTNLYSGKTRINKGILAISSDALLGIVPASATADQLTFGGGTLQATASFTLSANRGVALSGNGTILTDPSVTLTYSGTISGASALTKSGTGTLELSGASTYTGTTTVSAGVLRVQSNSALGAPSTATSITSGAAIEIDGTGLTIAEPISTLRGTGISATGALRNLANDNIWSGALVLGSGGARINSDAGTLTLTGGVTGSTRTITFGGAGNVTETNSIVTTTGGLIKDGIGTLTLVAASTYTGNTTINGGTLSISTDSNLGTPPASATAGKLAISGGTLSVTASMTLSATRGVAVAGTGATITVASGTTLTYGGIETGSAPVTKAGSGALDWSGATVTTGALTLAAGTITAPNGTLSVGGSLLNNSAGGAFVSNGTVSLTGASAATLGNFPFVFNRLTVTNTGGLQLTAGVTVNGLMTMSGGAITTNGNQLYISAAGSVTRTKGQVVGVLTKYIPVGTPVVTFEVGDATRYTPVSLTFSSVTTGGDLAVVTTTGDHPQLSTSTIDPTLSVNRYWTLSGPSIAFTSYAARFSFVAADIDVGATPADFLVEGYDGSAWAPDTVTAATATSTAATGVTQFGDFAVGEAAGSALDHFTITAPAAAAAGTAFDVTITAVDSAGNRVANYVGTVELSSSDPFAAFSPASYAFTLADNGRVTLPLSVALYAAGNQTVSVAHGLHTGTSDGIAVSAGPFAGLLVLLPGETSAPGSPAGRTGTPDTQAANAAFNITVLGVDAYWNPVGASDTVTITSSDPLAVLPPDAALVGGSATFSVALQASAATITATDVTDVTKLPNVSTPVPLNDTAPVAADDSFDMFADQGLTVPAPGVLANDVDPDGQPLTVASPMPLSGPNNGTLTLNGDGSFVYSPDSGFVGTDTFTYAATDGTLPSPAATVTIHVYDQSLISGSGWDPAFAGARYLEMTFPPYVPSGGTVTDATLHFSYRSLDSAGTTCYYVEVYSGGSLIGSHGDAGSPVSCNSGSDYVADDVELPEVDSAATADDVTVRIYMSNSASARSQINMATLGVDWFQP